MTPNPAWRKHPVKASYRASNLVTTASGTTISATVPSSPAVAGDLGLIVLSATPDNTPTTPAGWTLLSKVTDPTGLGQAPAACCLWIYKKAQAEGFLTSGDLGSTITFSGMVSKPMELYIAAYADGGEITSHPNVFFNGATQVNYNVPQHSSATVAGPYDLVVGAVSLGGYTSGAKTVTAAPPGATLRRTGGDGSASSARGIGVWDMPAPA